jgi:hypothetical protein
MSRHIPFLKSAVVAIKGI